MLGKYRVLRPIASGAQGGNWQTVCREKGGNKTMASSERPEMSGDEGVSEKNRSE